MLNRWKMMAQLFKLRGSVSRVEFKSVIGTDKTRPKEIFERTGYRVLKIAADGTALKPGQQHEAVTTFEAALTKTLMNSDVRWRQIIPGQLKAQEEGYIELKLRARLGDIEAISYLESIDD